MKKGIGLASVIVYIIGLCTILSIVTIFNINIIDSSDKFVAISKINEQYTKFNMFFLSSVKSLNSGATVYTPGSVELVLNGGNRSYSYDSSNKQIVCYDGENSFVVCKYVENASFTLDGNAINVNITFKIKDTEFTPRTIAYVIGRGY